jgi:hypothetical protein
MPQIVAGLAFEVGKRRRLEDVADDWNIRMLGRHGLLMLLADPVRTR